MIRRWLTKTMVAVIVAAFALGTTPMRALAATTPTLSVMTGNAGYMIVSVAGDPNASVQLVYHPYGSSLATTIAIGSTDSNGNFTGTLSASSYNIVNGTTAYVTVNGNNSSSVTWPSFTSTTGTSNSLALSQYTATLSVGQSVVIYSSNNIMLYSANSSNTAIANTTVNNGQVTIYAVASGSASVNICSAQGNCNTVSVNVLEHTSTLSLNQSVANIAVGQGVVVMSNNSSIATASSNSSNVSATANNGQVTLIGQSVGTGTVSVCNNSNVCDSIFVNVQNPSLNNLALSQNTISVGVGQTATIYALNTSISSATGNAPYVSTSVNSGSGGNQLTFTGVQAGTETVTLCGSTGGCNAVVVTVQQGSTTNNLSLTQYTLMLNVGQTATVSSGNSTVVTGSSNSSAASVSVSYGQATVKGDNFGTATVTLCNANNSCDSVYVTVQNPNSGILTLNKNAVTVAPGKSTTVSSANNTISLANSAAPTIATASVSSGQLTVTGVKNGSTTINVCTGTGSCTILSVSVSDSASESKPVVTAAQTVEQAVTTAVKQIYTRFLSVGSKGDDVTKLQNQLIAAGLLKGPATGKFDIYTKKGVQRFQTRHGLPNVGYVGPGTRTALNAEYDL